MIGVSGGVAAGKSTAADMLAELAHGELIAADEIGHDLLARDADARREITERFPACRGERGEISRAALGRIVFGSPGELAELNRIIHPRILRAIRERIASVREAAAWTIIDAALLFETGLDESCDFTVFVDASQDVRARRAQDNRGWGPDELARRDAAQLPPAQKRERSDFIVSNNGNRDETKRQIERTIEHIQRRWGKPHNQRQAPQDGTGHTAGGRG